MLITFKFGVKSDAQEFYRIRNFYDIAINLNFQLVVLFKHKENQLEFLYFIQGSTNCKDRVVISKVANPTVLNSIKEIIYEYIEQ